MDGVWSLIVRRRHIALSPESSKKLCRICGKRPIEVGYHIVPKQMGYGVRWLIENGCAACSPCNWGEHKNRALYRKKHIRIFGRERVEAIEERGGPTKLSMANLREVLAWLTRIAEGPPGATTLPRAPACLAPKPSSTASGPSAEGEPGRPG